MNGKREDTYAFLDTLERLLERNAAAAGDFQTVVHAMCVLYGFTRSRQTDEQTALHVLESALAFAVRQWRHGEAIVVCEDAIETAKKENKNEPIQPDKSA